MARAKSTGRAEARRRYRQAVSQQAAEAAAAEPAEVDSTPSNGAPQPNRLSQGKAAPAKPAARAGTQPARPRFMNAFRNAYHPAHPLEDLRTLPGLLRSWAFLAAIALVIVGAVIVEAFPNYTGGQLAASLLLIPGSSLAPQLVVGFFAPKASYLLGLLIGIVQGVVFILFYTQLAQVAPLSSSEQTALISQSLLFGPVSSMLFAAAAAWYRRFLSLSSPRRPATPRPASRSGGSRRAGR